MAIASLGYVGIESSAYREWETFGPQILGLGLAEDEDLPDTVFLKADDRHHRLAVHDGHRNKLSYLGWELQDDEQFHVAVEHLERRGITPTPGSAELCAARKVRELVRLTDPAGFTHELFYGQLAQPNSFAPGRPLRGRFVTGEQGFGHVALIVPDLEAEDAFVRSILGFRPTDEINMVMTLRFYHLNRRHHTLALSPVRGIRGIQHLMLELTDLDDVGTALDLAKANKVEVTTSLGRHTNDHMVSFYLRTPSGFDIEYGWGAVAVEDQQNWVYSTMSSASIWGHEMLAFSPPTAVEDLTEAVVTNE